MYSSVAVTALTADELETLLGTSRRNNRRDNITGLLLHVVATDDAGGAFVQVLEGDEVDVEACYARIETDDLHSGLRVLDRGPAAGRDFADWTMRLERVHPAEAGAADGDVVAGIRDTAAMERLVARFVPGQAARG
jgi:hypothetical protein